MADRTGEPRVVAFAQRQVTVTDWLITFGGVIINLIAAFGMVAHMNHNVMAEIHAERWLCWGFYLFEVSGVIWGIILVPCQIIQARQAKVFAISGEIPTSYWMYGRIWPWFGLLAILIPLANIYWMVVKA